MSTWVYQCLWPHITWGWCGVAIWGDWWQKSDVGLDQSRVAAPSKNRLNAPNRAFWTPFRWKLEISVCNIHETHHMECHQMGGLGYGWTRHFLWVFLEFAKSSMGITADYLNASEPFFFLELCLQRRYSVQARIGGREGMHETNKPCDCTKRCHVKPQCYAQSPYRNDA